MLDGDLLRTRVDAGGIDDELLIYSSCISSENPELLDEYSGTPKLHVCMEEHHINKAAWKIQTIARVKGLTKLNVLTVDGSPHCIQLHYALDDLRKLFPNLEIVHEVVSSGGKKIIKKEVLKQSRHLGELQL